jgi:hypothetical protein
MGILVIYLCIGHRNAEAPDKTNFLPYAAQCSVPLCVTVRMLKQTSMSGAHLSPPNILLSVAVNQGRHRALTYTAPSIHCFQKPFF